MHVQPTRALARNALGDLSGVSQASLLIALATLRDALAPGQAFTVPAVLDQSSLLAVLSSFIPNVPTPTTSIPTPVGVPASAPVSAVPSTGSWMAGMSRTDRDTTRSQRLQQQREQIGRRLRTYRVRHGLTQQELAEQVNALAYKQDGVMVVLDRQQVSKWENGKKMPSRFYRQYLEQLLASDPAEAILQAVA
jgi:DNA-binding XRE family transcriptional regulator